jgi:hypothetical protein
MELRDLLLYLELHFLFILVCIFACFADFFLELVALRVRLIDESPCFVFFADQFVFDAQAEDPAVELYVLFDVLIVCVNVV